MKLFRPLLWRIWRIFHWFSGSSAAVSESSSYSNCAKSAGWNYSSLRHCLGFSSLPRRALFFSLPFLSHSSRFSRTSRFSFHSEAAIVVIIIIFFFRENRCRQKQFRTLFSALKFLTGFFVSRVRRLASSSPHPASWLAVSRREERWRRAASGSATGETDQRFIGR